MELQRDDDGFRGTFQYSHTTEMIDGVKTRLCSRLFPCRYASPVTRHPAAVHADSH